MLASSLGPLSESAGGRLERIFNCIEAACGVDRSGQAAERRRDGTVGVGRTDDGAGVLGSGNDCEPGPVVDGNGDGVGDGGDGGGGSSGTVGNVDARTIGRVTLPSMTRRYLPGARLGVGVHVPVVAIDCPGRSVGPTIIGQPNATGPG